MAPTTAGHNPAQSRPTAPGLGEGSLGELLVRRKLLSPSECQRQQREATAHQTGLEEQLLTARLFTRQELLQILEGEYFCLAVDIRDCDVDLQLVAEVQPELLRQHQALPLEVKDRALTVAMVNPDDQQAREAIGRALARPVTVAPRVALRSDLVERIERCVAAVAAAPRRQPAASAQTAAVRRAGHADGRWRLELPPELTASNVVEALFTAAVQRGASDIHVEPKAACLALRMRVDGTLTKVAEVPAELAPAVASRLKILGDMDVSERRLPQDGRHSLTVGSVSLDLRLSSTPTQYGEKVVIRLLRAANLDLRLAAIGMPPPVAEAYQEVVQSGHGFYLVTGPTGSGKTTTLYATLNAVDCDTSNVVTFEDPIEYSLDQTTQTQVRSEIGLTFAAGLRAALRQDPDVILVGEIRDAETAEIACRAALTGHKVLSTLHTNDAAQAIPRLIDMGLAPHLLAATLGGVLAQRLLRGICPHCREPYQPSSAELALLGYPSITELFRGRGCTACLGSGYKGRFAVYEYLPVSEAVRTLIMERASALTIRDRAMRASGMVPMVEFARRAVTAGKTTVEEALRVVLAASAREQLCPHCQRAVSLDFAICPFCQTTLKDECQACGRSLDAMWEVCPHCGSHVAKDRHAAYCRHCQAPLAGQADVCPFCGGDAP